jgi:hypothetical protein
LKVASRSLGPTSPSVSGTSFSQISTRYSTFLSDGAIDLQVILSRHLSVGIVLVIGFVDLDLTVAHLLGGVVEIGCVGGAGYAECARQEGPLRLVRSFVICS